MGLRDTLSALVYGPPTKKAWSPEFVEKRLTATPGSLIGTLERLSGSTVRSGVWRRVSVREALGVPAIHRAVAIISSTTGMLSVQAYRNGVIMDEPPRIISRPDPYETPRAFYGGTAADMAKYGEFVWWISTTDTDGLASSLIRVPLTELRVEENPDNRLMPRYTWGNKSGTRYSGANPNGRFVHVKYLLGEPFDLRGEGPLQLCGVANSVAVESQNFAGNFYGEGGHPATVIKKAGLLSPTLLDPTTMLPDEDGLSEADILRNQVIGRANNTAMVIDDGIESIEFKSPDTVGAQMLDARNFNNGDAAREFGIPGPLLEYSAAGSSLTYQNRTELKGHLLEMCLMPLYLEPIEQAMSDLLTRSTVARFNVKGFLRADIKTRYDVHAIAITNGIYDPAYAQREEGIAPGDVEFAPVPFAAPASIPSAITKAASLKDVRCPSCRKLVAKTLGAGSELECPRCKTLVKGPEQTEPEHAPSVQITNHMPESAPAQDLAPFVEVMRESIAATRELAASMDLSPLVGAIVNRPDPPAPVVNVTTPPTTIAEGAVQVSVHTAAPDMEPMRDVTRAVADLASRTPEAPDVTVNVKQAALPADTEAGQDIADTLKAIERELLKPRVVDKEVIRDDTGRIVGVRETETR